MELLVLALAVGVVSADIGLTLNNYKVPETSYGVPSYQYSNSDEYNSGYAGANAYAFKAENAQAQAATFGQQNSGYGFQSASSLGGDNAGYQTGNYQNNLGSGSQYYQTGSLNSGYNTPSQSSYQFNDDASQAEYQAYNQYHTSSQYQSSAVEKYQQYYNQWQQQPPQIFKHFYVHAAPEEPEAPKIPKPIALPPPQKHYKIIFIKAPSQTVYTPQYIPVPQPNEEKTIVYVLVKKPEEQQEVVVPKLEQKPPAKPEVFFIKYNNKADSQSVINNIVSDYNKVDTVNFASGAGSEGQYTTGQLNGFGQYQGAYNQYAQNGSGGQTASGFGSQSTVSYTAPSSSMTSSTGVASTTANSLNAISTSQGVPHETYGPPTFRV